MKLSEFEMDALNELFNVGLHRAAASLSELTNQRVLVDQPRLWVCAIGELPARLREVVDGDLATVRQSFGGPVSGDATLLLEYEKAVQLANLTAGDDVAIAGRLGEAAREVLVEIGNVVLSACLGAFGNVLQLPVSFSVPRMLLQSVEGVVRSVEEGISTDHTPAYALVAATQFGLSEVEIGGYLIVVIGVDSLALISQALNERLV